MAGGQPADRRPTRFLSMADAACSLHLPEASTRPPRINAAALLHAFHCTDHAGCTVPLCTESKVALRRVEAHRYNCNKAEDEYDADARRLPICDATCSSCRLWAALHRTRIVCPEADSLVSGIEQDLQWESADEEATRTPRTAARWAGWARAAALGWPAPQPAAKDGPPAPPEPQGVARRGGGGLPSPSPSEWRSSCPCAPDPREECAVCYEPLGARQLHWTCPTCRGTLHSACWSRWAVESRGEDKAPSCPLCRTGASFRRYD